MATPAPGQFFAVMPYDLWISFRWQIALKVMAVLSAANLEAARYAIHALADAEKSVTVEWTPDKKQNVVMPWQTWSDFRWEIALNVISVMDAANLEVAKEAVKLLASAESSVQSVWRPTAS